MAAPTSISGYDRVSRNAATLVGSDEEASASAERVEVTRKGKLSGARHLSLTQLNTFSTQLAFALQLDAAERRSGCSSRGLNH